jgi:hypothetical protein
MGRGNNNLLYGDSFANLRNSIHPDRYHRIVIREVPNYHSPLERVTHCHTVYYPNGEIQEKHYGRKGAEQPFTRYLFNEQGQLFEIYNQAPRADYDYINGRYYQLEEGEQKEYETILEPLNSILEKPEFDETVLAHPLKEWDFPSYCKRDEYGIITQEQYWRYDQANSNKVKARDPRLGPAEINYYPSGNISSEKYWTACYRNDHMDSTLHNPYGPSEVTYYDIVQANGQQAIKSKRWTKLSEEKKNSLGIILKGFTETGRVDGGPGLQQFDEYGNLINEEYYGDGGVLKSFKRPSG